MSKPNEIKGKVGGMYSFKVQRADGTIEELGSQKNLITTIGIDRFFTDTDAASSYSRVGTFARIGTGNTAATTADTDLQTQTASTNTYDSAPGGCGTTNDATEGSAIHKRTFVFAAASGSSTITEVGVGWTASTASTLFSRIVLGTSISLNTGDILFVVYSLKIIFDQIVNSTEVNLTTGTFEMIGDLKIVQSFIFIFGAVLSTGAADNQLAARAAKVMTGNNGSASLQLIFGTNTTFPAVNTFVSGLSGAVEPAMNAAIRSVAHTNGTSTFVGTLKTSSIAAVSGIRTIAVRWIDGSTLFPLWILTDTAQTKELNKLIGFTYTTTFTQI
jgi:hypothetical protein